MDFKKLNENLKKAMGINKIAMGRCLHEDFIEKTNIPLYDNMLKNKEYFKQEKRIDVRIERMSPETYINKCIDGFMDNGVNKTYGEIIREKQDKSLRNLIYKLNNQDDIYMPYLHYTINGFNQEGLHRAIAAMECGIKEIPVLIVIE